MNFYKEASKKLLFIFGSLIMLISINIILLAKGIFNKSRDVSEIFDLVPIVLLFIIVHLIYRGHNWLKWVLAPALISIGGIIFIVKFPMHVIEVLVGIYFIVIGILIILEKPK